MADGEQIVSSITIKETVELLIGVVNKLIRKDQMKNKRITLISIIVMLFFLMISTDFYMAGKERRPIFAIRTAMYKDGGTTVYMGLGYKVIDYNQLEGRKDVVIIPFYSKVWETK